MLACGNTCCDASKCAMRADGTHVCGT
jgi:hypothetical protein